MILLSNQASVDIDHWADDAHLFDFSTEIDTETWLDDTEDQLSSKRAKLGGNSAVRRKQNREAARRSRMRKKQQENELQISVASYRKSNEALQKNNQALQDMLDLARYQVANLENGGEIQPIEIPGNHTVMPSYSNESTVDPLAVPPSIEISDIAEVDGNLVPSEVNADINDFIDVLLEDDDWVHKSNETNQSNVNEVSDDGSDHLDFLLDNDFWVNNDDEVKGVQGIPLSKEQPAPVSPHSLQVLPMVLSINQNFNSPMIESNEKQPMILTQSQSTAHLSRKEKNRIHARTRRMKVKMEHAHLKKSVDAYTQSNAMLKKKNKELELLLLKAHSYVAGATQGYQHYTTVFADGTGCNNSTSCGQENDIDQLPNCLDTNFNRKDSSSSGPDCDDDDHSLSFLWN